MNPPALPRLHVEFHCHTHFSGDSLARPEVLLRACQRKGINRLVITDHNTIAGALRCRQLDGQCFIVGEEIMTQAGELLAFYVQEEIPPGLPPVEAIARLREQGAVISVAHPFDYLRKGAWALSALLEIAPLVDAIEVFNARCVLPGANLQAEQFARQHHLVGTVGSDAHTAFEVGRATLLLPYFDDAHSLKQALGQAQAQRRLSPPWVHLASRLAVWRRKLERSRRPAWPMG